MMDNVVVVFSGRGRERGEGLAEVGSVLRGVKPTWPALWHGNLTQIAAYKSRPQAGLAHLAANRSDPTTLAVDPS